jgi:hypothetical protein
MATGIGLSSYLAEAGKRRWAWGFCDCIFFTADWLVEARGIDPAAPYRGAYRTAAECYALVEREGGLRRLLGSALARAGLERVREPLTGDIALVRVPMARLGLIGAIKVEGGWAMRTLRGLVVGPAEAAAVWRV